MFFNTLTILAASASLASAKPLLSRQKGTANEVYRQTYNILTDASSPLSPYGITMRYPHDIDKAVGLGIDIGIGTSGITLTNPLSNGGTVGSQQSTPSLQAEHPVLPTRTGVCGRKSIPRSRRA
ncbi:hypothetical protein F5Y00DRAFT_271448 [Daldinia vernicosa]|uniref:uncharacterized protein n=1 Tax=Daldinia vernicosa TaxID=114800 RepID=UPI0020088F83|nr:uncharacterized protein F5Y00DRAFT_271448 [Daldinia vernicosa]KAI0846947.1 hypothetical protein F5Y00DRAFT_271448 [Daldinia vernicosa]